VEALQTVLGRCLDNGLDLFLIDRGLHVTRQTANSDSSVLIRLVLELDTAHAYSERLSRRMLQAHEQGRKRQAKGEISRAGWAPEWIDLVDAHGRVIPSSASREAKAAGVQWQLNGKAALVQRVIELAEQGLGQTAIAQKLNAEGIPPLRARRAKAGGGSSTAPVWNPGQVAHLIQSPSVAGGRELKRRTGDITWDYYPAVIPRPRWEALRLLLSKRATMQTAGPQGLLKFIGQGCTTCASCGRPMGYRMATHRKASGSSVTEYVRCRGRVSGVCDQPSLHMDAVVAHILTRLSADQIGQLFPSHQEDGAAPLKVQLRLLEQQRDQARAMAAAAEQELSRVLATEPALAAVLGRQVVTHEQRASELDQQCQAMFHMLERHQVDHEAAAINDLRARGSELLKRFSAAGNADDLLPDRQAVNSLMKRLHIRVVIDASEKQVGMAAGPTAQLEWRPLAPGARQIALQEGIVNPVSAWDVPGIGSGVVEADGKLTFQDNGKGKLPADDVLEELGYQQGLEDARRIIERHRGKRDHSPSQG